jgi:hypothetical protein
MDFPHFLVVAGQDKGRQFPVHPGSGHSMGRNPENAYVLKDMRVSRFHCELAFENGTVTIKDRGGSGGTVVNGLPVTEQMLKHGDQIQVGETILRLMTRGDDPTTVGPGVRSANAEYDPKASEQLAELSGRTLARFELGEPLGTGTTSMVFRAKDTESGQAVALRVMQPAYARNEEDMQRFVRAMKAMLPLRHPNLVTVLAAGKNGPYCWAALELVEGESLTAVIQRIGVAGMLDWKYAFRVATHVGRALEYAHGKGIIHRDVAPPNILVQLPEKVAKLGDLMLAKAIEGSGQQVTKPGGGRRGHLHVAGANPGDGRGRGRPERPVRPRRDMLRALVGKIPLRRADAGRDDHQDSHRDAAGPVHLPTRHPAGVRGGHPQVVGQAAGGTVPVRNRDARRTRPRRKDERR